MAKRADKATVPGAKPFPYEIVVRWDDEVSAYRARVPAVGANAVGHTPGEALSHAMFAAGVIVTTGINVQPEKNAAAVALGRAGGLKGGAARAASMTKARRAEIAAKAAAARWKNKG